jgi:hypothetical protein
MPLEEALELDPNDIGSVLLPCPSTADSSWAIRHPEKLTLEILIQAPYHWFEKFERSYDKSVKSHGPEYELAKT